MSLSHLSRSGGITYLHGLLDRGMADGFMIEFMEWGHIRPENWRNYPHLHSFYEVCIAFAGSGMFTTDGVSRPVRAGDVFLARPGVVHEIVADPDQGLGISFWGFTLVAGPDADPHSRGWWRGLLDNNGPVITRRVGQLPVLIQALADEADRPQSGQRSTATALATVLAIETSRVYAAEADLDPGEPLDRRPALVAVIERYLNDNLDRPVTVRDIAGVVHLSQRHTERVFSAISGESLIAALRRRRMERAGSLLVDSELAVTAIARRCGYPEVRPFSTAFRRHYGQTPTEFRRTRGTSHL